MKRSKSTFIIVSSFMILISGSLIALNSDKETEPGQQYSAFDENTVIKSETMYFNMKTSALTFKNNVTVTNSQYTLRCNTLFVLSGKDNKPESMQAEGNIRIKAENGEATCEKATYSKSSGQFELEYDVFLKKENGDLSADKITATIKDNQIEVIKGINVRGSLPLEELIQHMEKTSSEEE